MSENKLTSDLLHGHTDTMILRLLSEADRYGYEIVKLIAERSGGEYELKEATMYSSVRRLEVDGEIEWYWGDESQGGRRKYFRITEKGKATYDRNKSNWEYAKRVLDNLLQRKGVVMNEKLTNYVNGVFAPYDEAKSVAELKADLLSDLQERFRELKAEGKDDETAFAMTIESIGDIEQTV